MKVRQIVFAPNDDTTTAEDLPADDPAWAKANAEAEVARLTEEKQASHHLRAEKVPFDD